MTNIILIAALSNNRVIGKDNDLPWSLPDDMKHFSRTTKDSVVIMGRKNYESIPEKYRPLPNRNNVVITSQPDYNAPGCVVVNSISEAMDFVKNYVPSEIVKLDSALEEIRMEKNNAVKSQIYEEAIRLRVTEKRLLEELEIAKGAQQIFVIGGGQIYEQMMQYANKLILTEVDADIAGDIFFPSFNREEWTETSRDFHGTDDKHKYQFSIVTYERNEQR